MFTAFSLNRSLTEEIAAGMVPRRTSLRVNRLRGTKEETETLLFSTEDVEAEAPARTSITYVLNTNTMRFHFPYCSSVNSMSERNRQDFTGTREEALALGYQSCRLCNP